MSDIKVVVSTNLPDFTAQLAAIGDDFTKKAVRIALRDGTGIFKKLAKARMTPHNRTWAISNNIYNSVGSPKSGAVTARVGVNQGGPGNPFYWAWVEGGHIKRGRGKAISGGEAYKRSKRLALNAYEGTRTKPVWYLRGALVEGTGEAVKLFYSSIDRAIQWENGHKR